jgi:hypothetical protein
MYTNIALRITVSEYWDALTFQVHGKDWKLNCTEAHPMFLVAFGIHQSNDSLHPTPCLHADWIFIAQAM